MTFSTEAHDQSDCATAGSVSSSPTTEGDIGRRGAKRSFLERVVPWPDAGGQGFVNLHWAQPRSDGNKFWNGRAYKTYPEMMSMTHGFLMPKGDADIYFCTSMQKQAATNKKGKQIALRNQGNVASLKSIWVDVDYKLYATPNEALTAFTDFTCSIGLPPPSFIVSSGNGVHVYWAFTTAISLGEWQPIANALKSALIAKGVKCDTGCTVDSVRILRIPGTLNHKTNPPKKVELWHSGEDYEVEEIAKILAPFAGGHSGLAPTCPAAPATARATFVLPPGIIPHSARAGLVMETGGEGLEPEPFKAPDLNADAVLDGCPFLKDTMLNGGAGNANPLWNLTTLVSACLNDEELAHELAKGHADYSQEETQALYERKLREIGRGVGWPSCKAFETAGCKSCATCPHFPAGKSPLHLGLPIAPQAHVNSDAGNFFKGNEPSAMLRAWDPSNLKVSLSNIPHRQWLYGIHLIRGEITVLASPGGVGKTALATGMAIDIATGKQKLGQKIWGANLKVFYISGEEGSDEVRRRAAAFCLAHNITEQDLDRLHVAGMDDPRMKSVSLLRVNEKGASVLNEAGFEVLESALASLHSDVVVLDPLVVFCGGGNMNDNAVMSLVMRRLKDLAIKYDCAVLIVHHTRKGADLTSSDAVSGASAIVNLARRVVMPAPMTEQEANDFGILPSERHRYLKLVDAKSNLAPPSDKTPWYELHNVELSNAEPPTYPKGDGVQAISSAIPGLLNSTSAVADDLKVKRAILDIVDRGKMISGKAYPYSPSLAGARNERALLDDAKAAVAQASAPRQLPPIDLTAITKRAIASMKNQDWLIEDDIENLIPDPGRFRKGRGIAVDWRRTPWPDLDGATEDGGATPPSDTTAPDEDSMPDEAQEDSGQLVNCVVNGLTNSLRQGAADGGGGQLPPL
jgi:hypothetical protein